MTSEPREVYLPERDVRFVQRERKGRGQELALHPRMLKYRK